MTNRGATPRAQDSVELSVPRGFQLPPIDVAGVIGGPVVESLHGVDDYVDTADNRLAAWGVRAFHRTGVGWLVELPAATVINANGTVVDDRPGGSRRQVVPVDGAASEVPSRVVDLTASFHRGAPLTRRTRVGLTRQVATFGPAATVSLERYRVRDDGREMRFERVRVWGASAVATTQIVAQLRATGAGDPEPDIAAPLGRIDTNHRLRPSPIGADASGASLVRVGLASPTVGVITRWPSLLRNSDPQAVHEVRRDLRRLRSALRTFALLDRTGQMLALRASLRPVGRLLGPVRDLEVLAAQLDELEHDVAPSEVEVVNRLAQRARAHRAAALQRSIGHLRQASVVETFDDLVRLQASLDLRGRADKRARKVVLRLLAPAWQRLWKREAQLGPDPTLEEVHRLRLAVRDFGMGLTMAAPVLPGSLSALNVRVSDLSAALGDERDIASSCAWLRRIAPDASAREAFVAGQLLVVTTDMGLDARDAWRRDLLSLATSDQREAFDNLLG